MTQQQENRIQGLFIDEPRTDEEVNLDGMIELVYLTIKIKGQPHPYTLDLTDQEKIRNLVLANFLTEDETNPEGGD